MVKGCAARARIFFPASSVISCFLSTLGGHAYADHRGCCRRGLGDTCEYVSNFLGL